MVTETEQARSGELQVVIADDDDLLRDGLVALVDSMPGLTLAAAVSDGVEAVEATRRLRPHVVLMDVAMPKMNGIDATRLITKEVPETHVLALTSLGDAENARAMLAAGAVGYLTKALRRDLLESSIREAACGRGVVSTSLATRLGRATEAAPDLGDGERAVLALLGDGLTNEAIARKLYISVPTVKKRVASLQQKLHATNRVTIAVRATQLGLVADPDTVR